MWLNRRTSLLNTSYNSQCDVIFEAGYVMTILFFFCFVFFFLFFCLTSSATKGAHVRYDTLAWLYSNVNESVWELPWNWTGPCSASNSSASSSSSAQELVRLAPCDTAPLECGGLVCFRGLSYGDVGSLETFAVDAFATPWAGIKLRLRSGLRTTSIVFLPEFTGLDRMQVERVSLDSLWHLVVHIRSSFGVPNQGCHRDLFTWFAGPVQWPNYSCSAHAVYSVPRLPSCFGVSAQLDSVSLYTGCSVALSLIGPVFLGVQSMLGFLIAAGLITVISQKKTTFHIMWILSLGLLDCLCWITHFSMGLVNTAPGETRDPYTVLAAEHFFYLGLGLSILQSLCLPTVWVQAKLVGQGLLEKARKKLIVGTVAWTILLVLPFLGAPYQLVVAQTTLLVAFVVLLALNVGGWALVAYGCKVSWRNWRAQVKKTSGSTMGAAIRKLVCFLLLSSLIVVLLLLVSIFYLVLAPLGIFLELLEPGWYEGTMYFLYGSAFFQQALVLWYLGPLRLWCQRRSKKRSKNSYSKKKWKKTTATSARVRGDDDESNELAVMVEELGYESEESIQQEDEPVS